MPFKNPHPLYSVWSSMRRRCLNPNYRQWNDYGGRGIEICSRWDDFHAFVKDMGPRPKGYTLDRIDNNQGYSPENCRWASRKQQQRNRREAVFVTIQGIEYRAVELAEKAGVKTDTIISRAKRGLPYEKVMSSEPLRDLSGLALGGAASGAKKKAKTHCPQGHPYTPDNLVAGNGGNRSCKICHRNRQRERNRRLRGQADSQTGDARGKGSA